MKNVLFTILIFSLVNFSCGKKEEVGDDSGSTSTTTSSDNSSTLSWSTVQFGTSSDDLGEGIISDSSNNYYITGTTKGGLDGNTNTGGTDVFLKKYNSKEVKQWTKQIGDSNNSKNVILPFIQMVP